METPKSFMFELIVTDRETGSKFPVGFVMDLADGLGQASVQRIEHSFMIDDDVYQVTAGVVLTRTVDHRETEALAARMDGVLDAAQIARRSGA